ncbi:alpha/beta fold hydrolase [Massilia sp. CF038]|uniref:alpha/beta fold hydrolase n=1 Tax=Massilia sp. CF038 TaxID=1881045 RepID=UPI0009133373|nr:alpha/beta hydrolase [Massilia sp. CF038]SHG61744.1 sigma-B regulation protein RsbQ [Massilia sp. CF038]
MDIIKRNNVSVRGNGPMTMLFAHGFGCDQNMWRLLAPHFETRFRTVMYDLTGSGKSDLGAYDRKRHHGLEGHAADMLEVLDAVDAGPTIVVGHSVSGMIGLLAAIERADRFAAQVMVGPSPCYLNDGDYQGGFGDADIEELLATMDLNFLGWSSAMAPTIMGAPDQPALAEELTNSFCRTDPEIAKHFARVTFTSDHRHRLPHSPVPSLILQCSDDIIAPLSVGHYMHSQMPGSQLRIIENVGHCPHLSAPSASVDAIETFLATLGH